MRDEAQDSPDGKLLDRIVRGLTVDDDGFEAWRRELDEGNRALMPPAPRRDARNHGFQNTVVHVRDQYGVGVDDHLLEFYEDDHDRGDLVARLFHESAIRKVHKYSGDASYRSVYVDCTRLARTIDKVHEALSLSITAYPELDERTPVGFTTLGSGGRGGVRIPRDAIARFFSPPTAPRSSPCSSPASSRRRRSASGSTGVSTEPRCSATGRTPASTPAARARRRGRPRATAGNADPGGLWYKRRKRRFRSAGYLDGGPGRACSERGSRQGRRMTGRTLPSRRRLSCGCGRGSVRKRWNPVGRGTNSRFVYRAYRVITSGSPARRFGTGASSLSVRARQSAVRRLAAQRFACELADAATATTLSSCRSWIERHAMRTSTSGT